MNIKAFIACWKRPEITRMCFENVRDLGLDAFCVVSEKRLANLCREFGFQYAMTENYPVGTKFNHGINEMMERCSFDWVLQMNSDTIIDPRLLTEVYDFKDEYFGVNQCHFYNLSTGEIIRYTYEELTVIGAGRMFSRDALAHVLKHHSGQLWRYESNKGLDNHSDFRMIEAGFQAKIFDLKNNPYVWDIKSETNIWDFEFFRTRKGAELIEDITLPKWIKSGQEVLTG